MSGSGAFIADARHDLCVSEDELRGVATPLPNPTPWNDPIAAPDPLPYPLESLRALVAPMVREELEKIKQELPPRKAKYLATAELCIDLTAEMFGTSRLPILALDKTGSMARARHAAMWLAWKVTGQSLVELGRRFHRDHSTVKYGIEKAEILRARDIDFCNLTDALFQKFKAAL